MLRTQKAICAVLLTLALIPLCSFGAERLHLLIPAGPGGGLDSTARAIGSALQAADLRAPVSYENMTGGGGGRAMAHFVETAERQRQTLLINSTPLIVRSLQGLFPHNHRDVVPIAGLVGEYGAFVVRADSSITSWEALIAQLNAQPGSLNVGGGSVRGSLDHIVLALAVQSAGINPRHVRYLPYDAGAKAMLALLGGEIDVLSTGVGETLGFVDAGEVRVLATTSPERLAQLPGSPTLSELGTNLVFANWRGLFAAPGTESATVDRLQAEVLAATQTPAWADALARYGWSPLNLMGDDFARYLDAQESQLRTSLTDLGFIGKSVV